MKFVFPWRRIVVIGLLALAFFGCRAQKEAASAAGSLTGILLVTGNEPFTDVSLQTSDGRMRTIQKDTTATYSDLRGLQGKKVRLQFRLPPMRKDSSLIIVEHYDIVTEK